MVGVYQIVAKGDRIYKYLRSDTEVGDKLHKRLKKQRNQIIFKKLVECLCLDKTIGNYIVPGYCLSKKGDYYSPMINGITLSEWGYLKCQTPELLVSLIISGSLLLQALERYYDKKGYLIGDWTLHNIIFNPETGYLVNIDLEGFYTYSPVGLNLSWDNGESDYHTIKNRIKGLQQKIIKLLYQRYTKEIDKKEVLRVVTTIQIPGGYQLVFPDYIINKYSRFANYIKYIEISNEIVTDNEISTVLIKLDTNNPYVLIIPKEKQYKYIHIGLRIFFTLPVKLPMIYKTNPLRSKLTKIIT